jgi:hypothetical protein
MPLRPNEIEAANRSEASALLIRCGFRVYHPEADVDGEDLILRSPDGQLRSVQLKGRLHVDGSRYGDRGIWMLFPDQPYGPNVKRCWFLVPHDKLFEWMRQRHGHTIAWRDNKRWSVRNVSKAQRQFLRPFELKELAAADSASYSPSARPTRPSG